MVLSLTINKGALANNIAASYIHSYVFSIHLADVFVFAELVSSLICKWHMPADCELVELVLLELNEPLP